MKLSFSIPFRKLMVTYLWWLCSGIVVFVVVLYYTFGLPLETAILDAVVSNTVIGAAAYASMNILRFYQPRQLYRLLNSVGLAVISVYCMTSLAPIIVSEDPGYLVFLERSFILRSIIAWLLISLVSASTWLWTYVQEQQQLEARTHENERLAKEAELSRLRQQLQPHFLFNSLNSISALVGTKPEEARKMIQELSDFLRGTLKKDEQHLTTLAEELEHLKLYLEIEKVRFGHRLKTSITADNEVLAMKLPPLLLQPIVENAIKFGLYDTTGEILISLQAKAIDNAYLSIKIQNPFDPETSAPRQGTGFGLSSVQRRLNLLYARQDLLTTSQNENIFSTEVKIPQAA